MKNGCFLIYILCFTAFGQGTISVLDETTKLPIEYVSILFLKNNDFIEGFYSNSKGELVYSKQKIGTNMSLSCIGYQKKLVTCTNKDILVYLKPLRTTLDEVFVVSKKSKQAEKIKRLKKGQPVSLVNGVEIAKFFDSPFPNSKVKSVRFYLAKKNKQEIKFRFHLYKIDAINNTATEELSIINKVFSIAANSDKLIEIDVSALGFVIPKEGAFLSIEVVSKISEKDFLIESLKDSRPLYLTRNYNNGVGWVNWNKWLPNNYFKTFNKKYKMKKLYVPNISID